MVLENDSFQVFEVVVNVPYYVPYYTESKLVNDIILNITSQEHLILTLLHIGSRVFEFFSKEVRGKKQPGMSLRN